MKRACIITIEPYPVDTFLIQRANDLMGEGYHVDIITIKAQDQKKFEQKEYLTVHRDMKEPAFKMSFLKYILNSLKFMFFAFLKLQAIVPPKKYDLILVFAIPEYLIFTTLLQKLRKTCIILYLLDLSYDLYKTRLNEKSWSQFNNKIVEQMLILSERISCAIADHLLTASPVFKQSLINRGIPQNKITVIMNTADDSIFKFNSERRFKKISEKALIIYPGTVSERFGILNVIKALPLINNQIPGTEFHIYGEYDQEYREMIEACSIELNVNENVFLHERKDLKTIYDKINSMDFGVVPYQNQHYMHIALSTKGFEYIASALPVVASRLRSMQSIFDEQDVAYFEPENEKELAEKIIFLCLNPQKRKEQVFHAHKSYQKVTAAEMRKRFLEVIHNNKVKSDSGLKSEAAR